MDALFQKFDQLSSLGHTSVNTIILIGIVILGIIWLFTTFIPEYEKWPPGPTSYWLMLYHMYKTKKPLHTYLLELRCEYGPIVSIPMLFSRAVYLHDFELVKRTIGNAHVQIFSGRPKEDYASYMTKDELDKALIINDGPNWRENKRLMDTFFNHIILADPTYENKIVEEMQLYRDNIRSVQGRAIEPYKSVTQCTANVINLLAIGKRYDYTNSKLTEFASRLDEFTDLNIETSIYPYFKYLGYIPFFLHRKRSQYRKHRNFIAMLLKESIAEHHQVKEPIPKTDLTYCYIAEKKLLASVEKPHAMFDDSSLVQHIIDLHITGGRATTSVIVWVYQYMIARPDVQLKVQKEIDKVIGKTRHPCYSDHENMPYTMAVIKEVMRLAAVVAFNVPRKTTQNVDINEFHIPQDTTIFTNLHAILNSEGMFKDHELFNPGRFIKDGKCVEPEGFVPYSVGVRKCFARPVADMYIFLHVTTVLQKFNLKNVDEQTLDMKRGSRLFGGTQSFHLIFLSRN